jgi:hypothetical protein
MDIIDKIRTDIERSSCDGHKYEVEKIERNKNGEIEVI